MFWFCCTRQKDKINSLKFYIYLDLVYLLSVTKRPKIKRNLSFGLILKNSRCESVYHLPYQRDIQTFMWQTKQISKLNWQGKYYQPNGRICFIDLTFQILCCPWINHVEKYYTNNSRCERLINEGIVDSNTANDNKIKKKDENCEKFVLVYLHALGAAIPRALNLALQLQR